MVRTPCRDKNGLRKGTWTQEEDRKLKAYITRYGCWNWRQLPKFAGLSRCGKSCRLRWVNYLCPNLKRGNFSKEEEDIIIKSHESLGNRWSAIAAQLPGRTDNEIKNHWHTYLKKRSRHISISNGEEPSSDDRSKGKKAADKRTSESKKSSSDFSTHQILESSHFSSPPELCSLMANNAAVNSTFTAAGFLAENDVSLSPSDMFDETTGSFWTEPFYLAGDYDDSTYDVPALFGDTGGFSPDYPVVGEEFLCSFGFYDAYNDVLNW